MSTLATTPGRTAAPRETRLAPGPPAGSLVFGHLKQLQADALGVLMGAFENYGDVSAFRFGPVQAFLLADPDHIEHVLLKNQANYNKNIPSYNWLKPLLGEGLLTSGGAFWQRQRRIAQPAFQRGRLLRFGPIMTRAAVERAAAWRSRAARGEPVDVHREMMHVALEIAGETLLGADVRTDSGLVARGLESFLRYYHKRAYSIFALPLWFPSPSNRKLRHDLRALDALVMRIIEARRRGSEKEDLLSMLMAARDEETGEGMTDRQLRDEVMTMLMAGHETTANALAWTWYLLARHPEAARRLRAELAEVLDGRRPTTGDLARLPYTKRVLEESMRLYPPAWVVERRALAEDRVGDYRIPPGSVLMMSAYVTHRHPGIWEEPERFDPERFLPDRLRKRHRLAYFPFGAGRRVCIGGSFAMLEARLVLATLAQEFEWSLVEGHPVELDPSVTLRPRNGLLMNVEPL